MTTGEKLKFWIKKNFGSVKNFAEMHGSSSQNISAYIKGKRDPGAPFLRVLIDLGCDINWLLKEDAGIVNEPRSNYMAAEVEKLREENKELKTKLAQINKLLNKER